MAEYIEREAARPDAFCEGVSCQECPFCIDHISGGCRVDNFVRSIPAADVAPVRHGRWREGAYAGYRCSECRTTWDAPTKFCPNCGAKMDGDGDV